jgi:peptide deformylase
MIDFRFTSSSKEGGESGDLFDAGADTLVADMFETMRAGWGVGLAAPQLAFRRGSLFSSSMEATARQESARCRRRSSSILSSHH